MSSEKKSDVVAVVSREGEVVPIEQSLSHEGSPIIENPLHDRVLKGKAYKMFLETAMDIDEIALSLGVNTRIVATWIRNGKWRERRQEIEQELMSQIESQYVEFLRKNKMEALKRQFDLGEKLETQISRILTEMERGHIPPSQELKRVAEALKLATDVTARAVGIKDTSVPDRSAQNSGNEGKPPLVVVLGTMPEHGAKIKQAEGSSVRVDNQDEEF